MRPVQFCYYPAKKQPTFDEIQELQTPCAFLRGSDFAEALALQEAPTMGVSSERCIGVESLGFMQEGSRALDLGTRAWDLRGAYQVCIGTACMMQMASISSPIIGSWLLQHKDERCV